MWRTQVDVGASNPSQSVPSQQIPTQQIPTQQVSASQRPLTMRSRLRAFLAWRKLDRAAAIDSAKNVFAVLGVGSVLADFSTMRLWLLVPGAVLLVGAWYADYLRHF
jgi:hypothetical protein